MDKFKSLRKFNFWMGFGHFVQGLFMLMVALNFDKVIHRYCYGKTGRQLRRCTPTFFHPSRRLSPEEATAERVAYNWEVVYDIDRSDVASVLENFENTYTQVEDFY